MPFGWECRARLLKQVPTTNTKRRGQCAGPTPGPDKYEPPQIFGGAGYGKIKRAPAYTFGHRLKGNLVKSNTTPNAKMFNVHGLGNKGPFRITHCVVSPHIEPLTDKTKNPGPAMYKPKVGIRYKTSPAYSLQAAPKPPYQPEDMWTAPPNMYYPPIPGKKKPAYTMGSAPRPLTQAPMPGPGDHDPNFSYVLKNKPAFSMGAPFRNLKPQKIPPPNTYCEKKFMVSKRTIPAPSFGIRHSPYIGQPEVYLKSSKLDMASK